MSIFTNEKEKIEPKIDAPSIDSHAWDQEKKKMVRVSKSGSDTIYIGAKHLPFEGLAYV